MVRSVRAQLDKTNADGIERPAGTPVVVTSRNDLGKITEGNIILAPLTMSERAWFGGKALGITYLITFFFVFIPILHFILVPAGLLIGVLIFFSQFSYRERVIKGSATCPICSQIFEMRAGLSKWPIRAICIHCCNDMKIEAKK